MDYYGVSEDFRANAYLENYIVYRTFKLGKFRIVNWVNFIHFIKEESSLSIEKLLNSKNNAIQTKKRDNNANNLKQHRI